MNLLLPLVLSAVLVTPSRPTPVGPDSGSVAFTTATVWLRASPTFTAATKRVALLPRGAQVQIIRCQDQACNVQFRRLQGYIARELLRATPAPSPVDPGRGYINSRGQWIPSPAQTVDGQAPDGATAQCRDGSYSFSQSRRGTCSWHGGVLEWLSESSEAVETSGLSLQDRFALLMIEHRMSVRITPFTQDSQHSLAQEAALH
jgi:Protein of unknown function (DUF3761)